MLPFIEALNLILDDKAADHDDFRNIMISGNIDQKRITSLIKRQKISNIKFNVPNQEFSDLSECDSAGNLAAVFTNLEDGDIFIIKYGNFQSVEIKDIFVEIIRDRKLSLIIGEDDAAREVKIDLPEFTMILNTEPYQEIDQDIADLFPLKLILGDHNISTSNNSEYLDEDSYNEDYEISSEFNTDNNLSENYDAIYFINIAQVSDSDWITIDGVGNHPLIYLHNSETLEGIGILGDLSSPKWTKAGDRNEIFQEYINEIFNEFNNLSGWNIEDINFLNELIEACWADDISDFEYENDSFETIEANTSNDLSNFVGGTGLWVISREGCSVTYDQTTNLINIDGNDIDNIFDHLLSNDRQHGYILKQK